MKIPPKINRVPQIELKRQLLGPLHCYCVLFGFLGGFSVESWVCLSQTSLWTEKYLMFVWNTPPPSEKPADITAGSNFMKLSLNSFLTFNEIIKLLFYALFNAWVNKGIRCFMYGCGDAAPDQTGFHHTWTWAAEKLLEPENVSELMMSPFSFMFGAGR